MNRMENTYFENVVGVSKSPYSHEGDVPSYPPKPFNEQHRRDRSGTPERQREDGDESKYFDKYVD